MRRSTLVTLGTALTASLSLSAISCKQTSSSPDVASTLQPLAVGADSDDLLAGLSPVLAAGHFVYSRHFIDPDTHLPESLGAADFTLTEVGPGEISMERDGKSATVDSHGKFLGSSDPMVSHPFASAIQLPDVSATRGTTWAIDSQPYSDAELQMANQAGARATSNVTFNYSLGAKSVGSDAVIYVLKRDVYAYVVPTQITLADAPLLEESGVGAFSPGLQEQVGTVYDYFVVRTSDQKSIKLGEAFLQFGRFAEAPAAMEDVFDGDFAAPAIALVSTLDPAASSVPSDMQQTVVDALASLPVDVKMWFNDSLPDGAVTGVYSPHVDSCVCTTCDTGDGGAGGAGGAGGFGGGGIVTVTQTTVDGAGGFGGGGIVTATDTAVDGAGGFGGGTVTVTKTTVDGAGGFGGGGIVTATDTAVDGSAGGSSDSAGGSGSGFFGFAD